MVGEDGRGSLLAAPDRPRSDGGRRGRDDRLDHFRLHARAPPQTLLDVDALRGLTRERRTRLARNEGR